MHKLLGTPGVYRAFLLIQGVRGEEGCSSVGAITNKSPSGNTCSSPSCAVELILLNRYRVLELSGMSIDEAIRIGSKERVIPIMMTSLTTILNLLVIPATCKIFARFIAGLTSKSIPLMRPMSFLSLAALFSTDFASQIRAMYSLSLFLSLGVTQRARRDGVSRRALL